MILSGSGSAFSKVKINIVYEAYNFEISDNMNISDLKAGSSDVELEATVVEKQEPREVITKYGKRLNVASAVLKDDTGTITLSLWGKDIESVNVGDKVKISKGYVGEFKGNPQLSTGKYGKIEVIGKGDVPEEESSDLPEDE
jgi:replication factor A1